MVGKVSLGKGAAGLIRYCYYEQGASGKQEKPIRGALLYSNELYEDYLPNGHLNIRGLAEQFKEVAALNRKMEKFIWHQSINFPPGEKVSNEVMVLIAKDFARSFGFENNQYLVFRHSDKAHDHFHLIGNRINASGENTATDQGNYERIQHFCRLMEQKYCLRVSPNHGQKIDARHNRENQQLERMKKVLDGLIPKSNSLSVLSLALKKRGIVMHLGRGISFTDKQFGFTFKGSDLGREYSRANIEKRLGKAAHQGQKGEYFDGYRRQALRDLIDEVIKGVKPYTFSGRGMNRGAPDPAWQDFGSRLKARGVTMHLRQHERGEIRGIAFQLGDRRYVQGRELGALYHHQVLPLRFGRSQQAFEQCYKEYQENQGKEKEKPLVEEEPELEVGYAPEGLRTRVVWGPNGAYETLKDLAKIADAVRTAAPKRYRRKIK